VIASCIECTGHIRDCTVFEKRGFTSIPVRGWYHTSTGRYECEGGLTMARPAPLVSVSCPEHKQRSQESCRLCFTSVQVSLYFHNAGRCIPRLCGWMHVR
jgi:hypothetical protein